MGITCFARIPAVVTMNRMQNAEAPIATVDVLVVDDNESVRHVVQAALTNYGYAVETIAVDPAAIEFLRGVKSKLIIAGAFAAEGDNLEVLVAMKAHGAPVIAMSEELFLTPQLEADVARQFGAARVLAKPFRLQWLISIVSEMIGQPTI